MTQSTAQTNPPWLASEPPKDGTTIVAIGRVIWNDEIFTSVNSFVAAIRWVKNESGYEGWHFPKDGMAVAQALDDEVRVDWWLPLPGSEKDLAGRDAHCPRQRGASEAPEAQTAPNPAGLSLLEQGHAQGDQQ